MGRQYVLPQPSRTLVRSPHRDQEGRMGRGQDGAGRWWCGGWKSQELDDHVLLLARKPADYEQGNLPTTSKETCQLIYEPGEMV